MKKVVVVGAGLAGLTAAYRLQTWGYEVEVYEARGRPGGRVCTAYFGEAHEELGGKNINDGGEAKNIRSLIHEMGLSSHSYAINLKESFFIFEQHRYSIAELIASGPAPTEELHQELLAHSLTAKHLSEVLDSLFLDNPPLRALMEVFMRGYIGSCVNEVSARYLDNGFWNYYKELYLDVSDPLFSSFIIEEVKGGNAFLIEALAHTLKGRIHYSMPLRVIEYTDQLQLTFGKNAPVAVECLILAIPDSTLRDVSISQGLFPEDQLLAINTRQYGTNAKILVPIEESTFHSSNFLCLTDHSLWFDEQGIVMTWYYGGEHGDFSQAALASILKDSLYQICEIVSPESIKTPVKMKDALRVHCDAPIYVSWILEEFSKGSYSNFSPGCYELFNAVITLHGEQVRFVYRPVKEILFFAGEHTAIDAPSTMEGAVESGERAARLIRAKFEGCLN